MDRIKTELKHMASEIANVMERHQSDTHIFLRGEQDRLNNMMRAYLGRLETLCYAQKEQAGE